MTGRVETQHTHLIQPGQLMVSVLDHQRLDGLEGGWVDPVQGWTTVGDNQVLPVIGEAPAIFQLGLECASLYRIKGEYCLWFESQHAAQTRHDMANQSPVRGPQGCT